VRMTFSGRRALDNARGNPYRHWSASKAETSARQRLSERRFLELGHRPRFTIPRDAPIFTMGSCFAREIEMLLARQGLPLLMKGLGVPVSLYDSFDGAAGRGGGTSSATSRGAFNKYSVHAMAHELKTILLGRPVEDEGLIALSETSWFDPQAAGLKAADRETALATRRTIAAAMARIREAKVVFLTLGLVESWVDTRTGAPLNRVPTGMALARLADRFAFVDHGFEAIRDELAGLVRLVRERANPEMRFVVTVSPVPFQATFKTDDVIVANALSKATLRAVADSLTREFDFVDYFPSYEMAVNSPREMAWKDDMLHVHPAMVDHITRRFYALYYGDAAAAAPGGSPAAAPAIA
jgi:hypothetical protein